MIDLIGQMTFEEKRVSLHLLVNSLETTSKPAAATESVTATPEKKTKKVKDPNAPKKAAAPGVKAWCAFVKHCKETQPELFTEAKKEAERLAICGGIKERDPTAYQAWVKTWIESQPSDAVTPAPAAEVEVLSDADSVIVVSDSEEVPDVDADLLKMKGQELRDAWALLVGKPVGIKSTGKLSTKTLLMKEITRIRAERLSIKEEHYELTPRAIPHPVMPDNDAPAPAPAPAPKKKASIPAVVVVENGSVVTTPKKKKVKSN
jgi:hypothetical protein